MRRGSRGGPPPEKKLRINDRIRAPQVRLIDDQGEQLGITETADALKLAREKELDLVEISPTASPPVCKLMNFGKYTYQQKKKASEAKKHQTKIKVKEVKFRPKVDEHDYSFKKKNALRFLNAGDKVKATIMFRGREIVHVDYGRRILERLRKELAEIAQVESFPKQEGNTMHMILAPRKQPEVKPAKPVNKREPKDGAETKTEAASS